MDPALQHLQDFVSFLNDQWMWLSLLAFILLASWFRRATSPVSAGRPSFHRR
jgi:hypothetical protein